MTPFNPPDVVALETFLNTFERVIPLREVAAGDVALEALAMRHDVDDDPARALAFADWETQRGWRASYYLLPTRSYWPGAARQLALALQHLGHEVGIHQDAYTHCGGDPVAARVLLANWLEEMQKWGIEVTGCADHGGGEPNNQKLWETLEPSDVGLQYEAYRLMYAGEAHYLTDSNGSWHGPLERREGRQTFMLIHPQHWTLS